MSVDMPSVKVKCPMCGKEKILRNMGRSFFKCGYCRVFQALEGNIIAYGVSLKRMKAKKVEKTHQDFLEVE